MNFLAHLYLSGNCNDLLLGNFIGDAVKGDKIKDFRDLVKTGILLHRKIDEFTDNHAVFKQSVVRLRPVYSKYSGVVTDILYDHFLAANWQNYSNVSLRDFADKVYSILAENKAIIPEKFINFVDSFIKNDRLYSYVNLSEIITVLEKMSIYRNLPDKSAQVAVIFNENYKTFEQEFTDFFADLRYFVKITMQEMKIV